jgi:hypothetical protein
VKGVRPHKKTGILWLRLRTPDYLIARRAELEAMGVDFRVEHHRSLETRDRKRAASAYAAKRHEIESLWADWELLLAHGPMALTHRNIVALAGERASAFFSQYEDNPYDLPQKPDIPVWPPDDGAAVTSISERLSEDERVEFKKDLERYSAASGTRANAQGLSGDDFQRFIAREMERAIDPATGQARHRRALQEAQVTTFQQELLAGTAGATVQMARSRHPVLTFVLPFVKTPINVLRYGWKMTPGLNVVQTEYREALAGRHGAEAQAQAAGQMALGSVFMGLAATMAVNGKITGAGPKEPNLQKELRATGWQPYSYVLEDGDGGKRYIPMGRFDPAGMVFSMVANLVEVSRLNPEGKDAERCPVAPGGRAIACAPQRSPCGGR